MISLYIKNQLCDAPPGGIDASFTYSIKNAQESGSIRGAATYTVSLPATPRNNQIFGSYWLLDASDFIPSIPQLFDAQNYNDCHLHIAGNEVFRGKCRLLEFSKEKYQLQLIGANLTWGSVFQTRKLREVDLDPSNWRYERWRYYNDICTYDKALNFYGGFVSPQFDSDFAMISLTLDELHLQFQTFAFPIVNYGDTLDIDGISQPMIEFYKIQASSFIAPLIFAHFAQLGYKLESKFFRNAIDGKSLALLYTDINVPALILAELEVPFGDPTNTNGTAIPPSANTYPYFFTSIITENYDSVNPAVNFQVANQASYSSYSPTNYEWEFQSNWKINVTTQAATVAGITFFVEVWINNTTVIGTASIFMAVTVATSMDFFLNVDLGGTQFMVNGDFINVTVRYAAVLIGPNGATMSWEETDASFFRAQPATMEGIITDLRDGLPDITVAELLKDLVSMFNLWVHTDDKLNTVYIETYDEFFKDISKDITLALDRTAAVEQKRYSGEFNRELSFKFSEDSGDALLSQYQDSHQANFGTGFLANADQTTRETSTIETSIVAPTLSGPWDELLFPRFRIPYLLNDLAQIDYATGEFAPRVVRISPPLTRSTASVGASFMKINFVVNPQGPVCAGPIGFAGAPTWTSFMTSPIAGTITYQFYPHAYFFDAVSNQDILNLPFNAIPISTNDVYAPASAFGLIARYYSNWWQHIQTGRVLSVKILLHRLSIDDLTDFREFIWLDKHQCYMSEIKNYKPGASQLVECELIMIK